MSGPYPFGCARHPRGTTRPVANAAHSRWPGGRARWADLPAPARKALNLLADQHADTQKKIEALTADIRADAKANEAAQRLQTIPGIGPMTASALVCALPDIAGFKSGRDLSAWPGADAATSCHWRQGTLGPHLRNGQQVSAPPALSRCDRAGQRPVPWRARRRLAVQDHPAQETQSRPRSPWPTAWRAFVRAPVAWFL
ncbi:MAG: transposase [Rhodobacter sp.]|nr:transposase [Rhodobacter sp.]